MRDGLQGLSGRAITKTVGVSEATVRADPPNKSSELAQGCSSRCPVSPSLASSWSPGLRSLRSGLRSWPSMRCISCGVENPADASFCGECAAPSASTLSCPFCGKANPAKRKFCNGCGRSPGGSADRSASLDPRAYTPKHLVEKILTSRSALEGERKQVTVLFADVKGRHAATERATDCLRVSRHD
jgi:hypothetical protein